MPGFAFVEAPLAIIVDTDEAVVSTLRSIAETAGFAAAGYTHFEPARRRLMILPPAALVANVRLEAFNGIHLAYLAKLSERNIRSVIYARPHDPALARDAQRAGAFYERQDRLVVSLGTLLKSSLPVSDRRGVLTVDRRQAARGGRRCTDAGNL